VKRTFDYITKVPKILIKYAILAINDKESFVGRLWKITGLMVLPKARYPRYPIVAPWNRRTTRRAGIAVGKKSLGFFSYE
jgi:hypothetical protein